MVYNIVKKRGLTLRQLKARLVLHQRRRYRRGGKSGVMRPIKMNYFITKIRGNFAELGGNVNGAPLTASFLLNFPLYYRNSVGSVGQMQVASNHYTRAFNLFDEYKVIGLKVQLRNAYSQIPVQSGYSPTTYVYPTGNAYYPIVYSAYDDDSDENMLSVTGCLTGTNVRRSNFMTGRSITRKAHPRGKIDKQIWYNTGIPNPNVVPDATNTLTYQMPKKSALKFFLENCPNATIGWDVYAEWTVMFKGLNISQLNDQQEIQLDHEGQTGSAITTIDDPIV